MTRLSVPTLRRRIEQATREHVALLRLRGAKTSAQINRMDTVRKKLRRLTTQLALSGRMTRH